MTELEIHEGGCLCGRVRFRFQGAPLDTGYCHCRMCQRSSGAPAQPFVSVPIGAFSYTGEPPQVYRSSEWGERRFCPSCGSQLEYRERENPSEVSLNAGCLDEPGRFPPGRHIYTQSRLAWFDAAADLPSSEAD